MLALIIGISADDIINAYNSYKLVKSEILSYKRYVHYKDLHSAGFPDIVKTKFQLKGVVLYNLLDKRDEYELSKLDKSGNVELSFKVITTYNEISKNAQSQIIFDNGRVENDNTPFIYVNPYFVIKYLLSNNHAYNIIEQNDKIILKVLASDKDKIEAILNPRDYTIKHISYFKNDKKIIEIEYTNTQIVQ